MHNSQELEDLRIRRTRKTLQEAMIALSVEKGFANISVRDITERAMVNRSTFYRHYLDKCDLLGQYMQEVYEITSSEKIAPEEVARTQPPAGLIKLLKHIESYADFYRVMLGSNGDPGFTQDFRKNIEKRFRSMLARAGTESSVSGIPLEMRLNYVSYAGIGAIVWWLESNQPCTVEQLAKWMGQLSKNSAGVRIIPDSELAQDT